MFILLTCFADNEPILCITDLTNLLKLLDQNHAIFGCFLNGRGQEQGVVLRAWE